jgi:hypothetical protein
MEKFEFIFEHDNTKWHYESFGRMADGLIREQKNDVLELLSHGFDKLLLNKVECEFDKNDDMEVVEFELEERKDEKISPVLELGEEDAIDLHNTKYNMQDIKNIKIGHRRLKV